MRVTESETALLCHASCCLQGGGCVVMVQDLMVMSLYFTDRLPHNVL